MASSGKGLGNRFLYTYLDANDYVVSKFDPGEYFSASFLHDQRLLIDTFSSSLKELYYGLKMLVDPYCGGMLLTVHPDAGNLWADFKLEANKLWAEKARADPLAWNCHYLNRLPLQALKLAGVYAFSSQHCDVKKCMQILIEYNDMARGIVTVLRHYDDQLKIFDLKERLCETKKADLRNQRPVWDKILEKAREPIQMGALLSSLNMTKKDIAPHIDSLLMQEKLFLLSSNPSQGGRSSIHLCANKSALEAVARNMTGHKHAFLLSWS